MTRSVDESSCAVPKAAAVLDTSDREAFVWFRAQRVRSGEELKVEWLAPDGTVALDADYQDLPDAQSLCFVARLPIAGFGAAAQTGAWTARIVSGQKTLGTSGFRMNGVAGGGSLRVNSVERTGTSDGMELTVEGAGFTGIAMVHIAQYTSGSGWRYVSAAQPRVATPNRLVADYSALPPAEYLVIVRNGDGQVSRPVPFVVPTTPTGGYKLPTVAGEAWILTQGPYGTFSHWGRTLHAYDIAPRSGRCIVAMRGGIVHVHDIGAGQDHTHKTFGNYITIDHGDGEYSHYAHLATGTFVVSEGQRVEQGQALATVGNSGYTLGEGGGYHVHVQVTRSPAIASQSVPFYFDDLGKTGRGQSVIVSSNSSSRCDCRVRAGDLDVVTAVTPVKKAATADAPQFSGSVAFNQWWSNFVAVPSRAAAFEATLTWTDRDGGLDLHLMSPSGHHYAWYADPTGYSGTSSGPQQFRIPHPEPGTWRISVQGVRGGSAPIDFAIKTSGKTARIVAMK
ncbi:MAG: peptidoglycan DD-metalloendopeptidase family protein [Bryobacteraceae bacterium]